MNPVPEQDTFGAKYLGQVLGSMYLLQNIWHQVIGDQVFDAKGSQDRAHLSQQQLTRCNTHTDIPRPSKVTFEMCLVQNTIAVNAMLSTKLFQIAYTVA